MRRNKYTRRRRRLNPRFVIMIMTLAILLMLLVTVLLHRGKLNSDPQPGVSTPVTTQSTTNSTTQPTTVPITMPTTEPTIEPTTEATAEATTEPTTAPTEKPTEPPAPESSAVGERVAELARKQIGKPYLYGGVGPDSFDASGLVVYCYAECGVEVPRTATYQISAGKAVPRDALEPGDVVFFWTENPGTAEYEAIYVGNGKIVAARNGDKPVSEMDLLSEYFSTRYVCARRYY